VLIMSVTQFKGSNIVLPSTHETMYNLRGSVNNKKTKTGKQTSVFPGVAVSNLGVCKLQFFFEMTHLPRNQYTCTQVYAKIDALSINVPVIT
jgi:peptide subunit release factor RF-3